MQTNIQDSQKLKQPHQISAAINRELGRKRVQSDKLGRPFKACPIASPETIEACERALGLALPPPLREIYLQVANGGFGPGYGVVGVEGGFNAGCGTLTELTNELKRQGIHDPTWQWKASWLPFCNWGCGMYSVVDCVEPYPVCFLDSDSKTEGAPMSSVVFPHKESLTAWLADWLSGKDLWGEVWR